MDQLTLTLHKTVDVLDGGHEQVARLAWASGAAVEQVRDIPHRTQSAFSCLSDGSCPHHGLETGQAAVSSSVSPSLSLSYATRSRSTSSHNSGVG